MRLIVERDVERVAARAADWLAAHTRAAIGTHGRAVLALSGGSTPWPAFERYAAQPLPWQRVWITQVDERVVARDDPRRNGRRLEEIFVAAGWLPATQLLALPVDALREANDTEQIASVLQAHEARLRELCGGALDVAQLGLGADGHTASLLPGDPLLDTPGGWIGLSREHEGVRRLTLTTTALAQARAVLWIVTGSAKSQRLAELWEGRGEAPALRVPRAPATVICDAAAAQALAADDDVTA